MRPLYEETDELKVLVVDAVRQRRQALIAMLQSLGIRIVRGAIRHTHALSLLQLGLGPDIVLLDGGLPDDGAEKFFADLARLRLLDSTTFIVVHSPRDKARKPLPVECIGPTRFGSLRRPLTTSKLRAKIEAFGFALPVALRD